MRIEPLPDSGAVVRLPWAANPTVVEFGVERVQGISALHWDQPDALGLSAELVERLQIPAGLRLQARCDGRRLRLGPAVGIIGGRRPEELAPRLPFLANHLLTVRDGLFVATDLASLSAAAGGGPVKGQWRLGEGGWAEGEFPLPKVLFRRYGAAPAAALLTALQARGALVMNERIFHKEEAARWLAADPELRPHLPETVRLAGVSSVLAMLERHPSLFVKPVWGSLAGGILRVRRWSVETAAGDLISCADAETLAAALTPLLPRTAGLVQQGLELAGVGGRMIDFRVIVQKNGHGEWQTSGMVARAGEERLFVSNMATGGFPFAVADALALLFGPAPEQVFRRKLELARLGIAAAKALEAGSGLLLGDLGLDMAYDHAGHLWLIEANNRDPDHNIGWEAGDWSLFYRFRQLPLRCACALAGFPQEDAT
jgi:hypothetical protein